MRVARLPLFFVSCIGVFACGVTSPRAVAEPRNKGDDALVKDSL